MLVHDFDDSGSFKLHFDINTDTFTSAEREQLVEDFFKILDAFIESRESVIDTINLLDDKTTSELLESFNKTSCKESKSGIVQWFSEAVGNSPNHDALICYDEVMSFAELDRKSNQLANHLTSTGMKERDIVGICLERKPDLLITLLAVHKVGAAFVPIDPQLPQARQEYLLSDSGASWFISEDTDELLTATLKTISLEKHKADIGMAETEFNAVSYIPGRLAYILYTSGSTGKPKGVRIANRALVNYLNWARKIYIPSAGLSMAVFSTISADLTITSLFLPLISGGTAVLYPQEGKGTDLSIVRVAKEDRVDIIKLTPSHLTLVDKQLLMSNRLKTLS